MALLLPIFVWGAIVVGLLSFILFKISRRRMYELAKKIPGLPELPIIGNAHQFAGSTKDILVIIKRLYTVCLEHEGVCKTWIGPKLYIALTDPKAAETVMSTEITKADAYQYMHSWVGNGLVTAPVSIWKRHRKMLSPCFNQKVLDGFMPTFSEQSNILVEKMASEVGKGPFDIFKYISLCTLDIICETAMGAKVNSQNNQNMSYVQAGITMMNIIYKRMFQLWLQPNFTFKLSGLMNIQNKNLNIAHSFTDRFVKLRKEEFHKTQKAIEENLEYVEPPKYKAFLDTMIASKEIANNFTDIELRNEVDTLTIAANDTSSHEICYIFSILAYLPHIQQKVVDELREIYGDSDRPIDKEDFAKMKYMDLVIKETLRLFPAVPIIVRQITKEVKLEKYTLPAGSECVVAILGMHRDKSVWGEDAEEFNPDRFLKENYGNKHPYSYIPYSAGPRNCIGKNYAVMSLKSIITSVLRSYKLHSTVDYRTMPLKAEIILKAAAGYMVSIEKRNSLYD